MLHLLTNTNSKVKINSYIRQVNMPYFNLTKDKGNYTGIYKDDDVKFEIENFEFRKQQSISNARIICYFKELSYGDIIFLYDSNEEIIDRVIIGHSGEYASNKKYNYISFDITNFLEKCRKNNEVMPMYMKCYSKNKNSFLFAGFNSIDYLNQTLTYERKTKYFYFSYADVAGLESSFSYIKKDLGLAGMAFINLKQGHLIYEIPLSLCAPNNNQIMVNLTYNSLNFDCKSYYGLGFKGPFDYELDLSLFDKGIIKLTDPSLKESHFKLLEHEETYKLTLEKDGNIYYCYADSTYIVEKKGVFTLVCKKNKMSFIYDRYKTKIISFTFEDGKEAKVKYNDDLPIEIVYFDGMKDVFEYENEHLKKFTSEKFGIETILGYKDNNLSMVLTRKIQYNVLTNFDPQSTHIKEIYFEYDEKRILNFMISNFDRKALKIKYDNFKIAKITECGIDYNDKIVDGKSEKLTYGNNYTILEEEGKKKKLYHFDAYGSCDYTLDENCVSNNFKFGTVTESDKNMDCHLVRSNFKSISNIPNLLYNGSFEFENNPLYGWNIDVNNNVKYGLSKEGLYGENCLIVNASKDNLFEFSQVIIPKKSGTYKLTGFYKSYQEKDANDKITIRLQYTEIVKKNGLLTRPIYHDEKIDIVLPNTNGKWKEFSSEMISIKSNCTTTIIVSCSSTIMFDEMQLTCDNFIGGHNFLRNSHFEIRDESENPLCWTFSNLDDGESGITPSELVETPTFLNKLIGGYVYKLSGSITESIEREISQVVKLKGDSGENLIVNCWFYGNKTSNEKLQLEIYVHYTNFKGEKLKKYIFTPTSTDDWCVLTGLVNTEYSYDFVIVKFVHNGFNDIYVDAIQLFKSRLGNYYSYDEKGNLMMASDINKKMESSYDKNGRLLRKSCVDGQQYQYTYNPNNNKIIGIKDNFGNDVSFSYLDNGIIKEIKSGNEIIRTEEIQDENKVFIKKDELNVETKTIKDEFGNIISYYDGNGNIVRKLYNNQQKLIEIERSTYDREPYKTTFGYDKFGKINGINSNTQKIKIDYDEFGNVIRESINDDTLNEYYYNSYQKVESIITFSNNRMKKTIEYDDNGNVSSILDDGIEIAKLKYDDAGKLIETNDLMLENKNYFNYDTNGLLVSISDTNDNRISYEYDNLDNVEKEIVKLNGKRIASSFIHDYEFNEADRTTFFERLSRTYQDDIIVGDHGVVGLYGAKPKSSIFRYTYDETVKMNTIELAYAGKELNYNLIKVNSNRQNDLSSGGDFNKFLWNLNFKHSKTVYGWIKVLGKIDNKNILKFSGHNINVKLVALTEEKLKISINEIEKDILLNEIKIKNWNMYAISVFDQNDKTHVCFYLNGILLTMLELNKNITEYITDLTIGDNQLADGQKGEYQETNQTPIRIAMLSIGAYHYKKVNFKAITDISKKFLFETSSSNCYSGVTVETCKGKGEYFSLNGSFKSLKGTGPSITSYSDGSFKIDKSKNFEFDREILRHVYSCYNGIYKLKDQNASRLTYDLNFLDNSKIFIRFKPTLMDNENEIRTIFSLNNETKEIVKLYLDNKNYLHVLINNEDKCFPDVVLIDRWNSIMLDFFGKIDLNGHISESNQIKLSNASLNIGCSIKYENDKEIPCNYLNGLLCDLYISNEYDNYLNSISSLTQKDDFGRKISKVICFDDKIITKTDYKYVLPKDEKGNDILDRTSLLVDLESNNLLGTNKYKYDNNRNIVSITKIENDKEVEILYEYDMFDRLIKSINLYKHEINIYEYDDNGNILLCYQELDGHTIKTLYKYDEYFNRLVSVFGDCEEIILEYNNSSFYPSSIGKKKLNWQLDKLTDITSDEFVMHNDYDYLSRRTRKVVNGDETQYIYDQNKLIGEIIRGQEKIFIYDDNNKLIGFHFYDNTFFFIRNEMNIIEGIIDLTGKVIARYSYDDFGKLLDVDKIDFKLNDIFYKGYLYDRETGWYLLNSRFYAPELKRFISPDKVDNLIHGVADLIQFNLYSYCDNNPVMRSDNNGQFWFFNSNSIFQGLRNILKPVVDCINSFVGKIEGGLIGGVVGLIGGIANGESIGEIVDSVVQGATDGARIGSAIERTKSSIMFGDFSEAKDIWNNEVIPDGIIFVQNNIMSIMGLADVTLSLIQQHWSLINSSTPLGLIVNVACEAYLAAQSITAETNLINNANIVGENEKNLICPTNSIKDPNVVDTVYLQPTSEHNIVVDDKVYLTNQDGADIYTKLKFGGWQMKENGCEIIATYNMLRMLGKNVELIELIYYFEKKNLFLGGFGTWPKHIKELFDDLNIKYDFSTNPNDLPKYTPSKYKGCITTYFNRYWQQGVKNENDIKRLTIHTTFWPTINKYYYTYNNSQQILTKVSDEVLEVNGNESSSKSKIEDEIKINPTGDEKKFISIFGLNN